MRKRLVRLLAWVVTAALLFYIFRRVPFSQVVAAARGAAWWTVPAVFVSVAGLYIFDSFAIWKVFGWFVTRMSFVDVLLVRGGDVSARGRELQRRPGRDRLLRAQGGRRPHRARHRGGAVHHGGERPGPALPGQRRAGRGPGGPARGHGHRRRRVDRVDRLRDHRGAAPALAGRPPPVLRAAERGRHRSPARVARPPAPHRLPAGLSDIDAPRLRRRGPGPRGGGGVPGGLLHRGAAHLRPGARHHPGSDDLLLRALRPRRPDRAGGGGDSQPAWWARRWRSSSRPRWASSACAAASAAPSPSPFTKSKSTSRKRKRRRRRDDRSGEGDSPPDRG